MSNFIEILQHVFILAQLATHMHAGIGIATFIDHLDNMNINCLHICFLDSWPRSCNYNEISANIYSVVHSRMLLRFLRSLKSITLHAWCTCKMIRLILQASLAISLKYLDIKS